MSKLPETGPSLVRHLRQQQRRMIRNENSSPFTRSGTSVTAENEVTVVGQMRSADYDGTSRADLGTAGWMLGPDDGGASLLALNGIDVYATLAAQDALILAQQATLAAQVATIAALVGAQVSPVDFATEGTGWSNGASGGGTVHASVILTAPAGFTRGLVTANMYVQAVHTGGADYLRIYPEIHGVQGRPGGTYVNAGAGDQTNISYTRLVSSTSFAVDARVWSSWAVPADAANIANITGSVLWLR